ncbi:MAG: hypothetical protein QM569_02625 [Acidovorax sp.]|uniref:alpha/beta fold hydrolase n=1 Tax=Acidovorax sp. TaxID=1872122 RepID=UPI0039E65A98
MESIDHSRHHCLIERREKSRLSVFFSGTDKTDGRFDFWRSGSAQNSSVLFFNNGLNEWYQNGVPGVGESIPALARYIEKTAERLGATSILLSGVSMGGYAAVLFGALLHADVVAFGYDSKLRLPHSRSAKRMPKEVAMTVPDLKPIVKSSGARILHFAGELDGMDMMAAHHMYDLENIQTYTLRGVGHGERRSLTVGMDWRISWKAMRKGANCPAYQRQRVPMRIPSPYRGC